MLEKIPKNDKISKNTYFKVIFCKCSSHIYDQEEKHRQIQYLNFKNNKYEFWKCIKLELS